jgi:hypothetical protein
MIQMASKAEKLLERMRQSKSGWKRRDLDKLYEGFGFIITPGRNHDIVKHPVFSQLRTTLPRHTAIAKGYVQEAIKIIDRLKELERGTQDEPGTNQTS